MQARSTPDALWRAPSLPRLRPAAVECIDLRRGRLLRGCTLRVPPGMRLLVVAEPQESGSLLVRILAGLARGWRGRVEIAGLAGSGSRGRARRIAYVGPEPGIHAWMTPRETLELAAALLELGPEAGRRIERAAAWARISIGALDAPMRRAGRPLLERTALAAALLAEPEVLLLDEPLRGIDPDERASLLRIPGRRLSVVLSSRLPSTEEDLVTHVAVLRHGRIELLAPVRDLVASGGSLSRRAVLDAADAHRRSLGPAGGPESVAAS